MINMPFPRLRIRGRSRFIVCVAWMAAPGLAEELLQICRPQQPQILGMNLDQPPPVQFRKAPTHRLERYAEVAGKVAPAEAETEP
jgi:hypothetical protein